MTNNWPTPPHSMPSPEPDPPGGQGKRIAMIAGLVTIIAALLTTAGLVLIDRSDTTSDTANYVATAAPQAAPVFEPRGAEGEDAFFPLDAQLTAFTADLMEEQGLDADDPEAASLEVSDDQVKTGLYGGTAENTCDPERLISYLYDHPDKGAAWAQVQGIEFNEIGSYIRSLEIRVLAEPAIVLNHGYHAQTGAAYEVETTLDAGTAVLVDSDGDIRTRCYCGNPVKPKPPAHRAPRCLILTNLVFATPGGARRDGVPGEVDITGQVASYGGADWTQIMWGTDEDQTGWTESSNVQTSYCPPPTDDGAPCAETGSPVWSDPSGASQIGRLGGQVRTAEATTSTASRAIRAGSETGALVENGFVLIEFTRAAPSESNSAWVAVSDLRAAQCDPITVCVDTEGSVLERPGGYELRPGGNYFVSFTGHFAGEPVSSAEIQFVDGGGRGWISNFYTPLDDSRCDSPVGPPRCVPHGAPVWPSPSELDRGRSIGTVRDAMVSVLDQQSSQGRIHVEVGPGGPEGWIDEESFGPPALCRPIRVCTDLLTPVYPIHPTAGTPVAGTPAQGVFVQVYSIVIAPVEGGPHYMSVGVDGKRGWIPTDGLGDFEKDHFCRDDNPGDRGDLCSASDTQFVFTTPTSEGNDVVARINNARLSVIEPDAVEGRLRVQAGDNGPIGWIDSDSVERYGGQCRVGPTVCLSAERGYEAPHDSSPVHQLPGGTSLAAPWRIEATAVAGPFIEELSWQLFEVRDLDRSLWFPASVLSDGLPTNTCKDDLPAPGTGTIVCVASQAPVYASTSGSVGDQIALVNASQVELLTENATDGFHQVRLTPVGPIGWIPTNLIETGLERCPQTLRCIDEQLPAFIEPNRSSLEVPADRLGAPSVATGIRIFATPGARDNPADLLYFTIPTGWYFAGVESAPGSPGCDQPSTPTPTPAPTPAPTPTPVPSPTPDSCPDTDGDGICDADDNCRDLPNSDQSDVDDDDRGDVCDPCTDIDRDLHCAETDDTCPNDYDLTLRDTDRDGVGDVCDSCPTNPQITSGGPCEVAVTGCSSGSYLGLSRSDGERYAGQNNCKYRIVRIDDEHFNVTFDFVSDRMNWQIDNGIITNITLG